MLCERLWRRARTRPTPDATTLLLLRLRLLALKAAGLHVMRGLLVGWPGGWADMANGWHAVALHCGPSERPAAALLTAAMLYGSTLVNGIPKKTSSWVHSVATSMTSGRRWRAAHCGRKTITPGNEQTKKKQEEKKSDQKWMTTTTCARVLVCREGESKEMASAGEG